MEKGKGRPETGRSSTDILSRIRETAASKPEHQIRHLTEENRRLIYELGIAQADLARLQGEQEQLVEAYDVLEKRHDDDVQRLTKELEEKNLASAALLARLQGEQEQLVEAYGALEKRHDDDIRRFSKELEKTNLASAALEKERDSLKLKTLGLQPLDELKDVANKPTGGRSGAIQAPSGTDGSASQAQSTRGQVSGDSSMQGSKDEVRRLNEQLAKADKEIRAYRYHYNNLTTAFQHANLERHRFKEATIGMENELLVLWRDLKDAQNLAAVRGKDPVGPDADVSFTKADSVSLPEVIAKASNLNEEIFQAATLLGESLTFEQDKEMTPEEMKQCTDYCTKIIGPKVTEILVNEATKEGAHEVNSFLVQVVVQIFLVKFCHGLVEFWKPNDPQYSEFLEHTVYKSIRDSEEQTVSGRWRSLTRKHIRPTTSDWDKKGILNPLSHIFKIASWVIDDEENRGAFEQRFPLILKAVEELRLAIGEQFISADIHLALMESDQPFVREYMEDVYGDDGKSVRGTNGRPPPPKIVLGTVGFGLHQVSKDQRLNGTVLDYNSVKPAKVVLVSTVMEALARPPRRKQIH